MRQILSSLILLLLLTSSGVHAQQVVIEGTGTLSDYRYGPLHTQNAAPRTNRSAFIYSESLLTGMIAGSIINELSFRRANAGPALPAGNNLKLYLMNTTSDAWPTGALTWDVSAATLVFDGDPSGIIGTTDGYKTFGLSAGFLYQGNGLVLFSEYQQLNAPASTINWSYNTPATQPAYNANQVKYTTNNNSTYPSTLSTTTGNHPNMIIGYAPPPPCTTPSGGLAVASAANVCSGDTVRLNLTGYTPASGQTYAWQSFSTPGGPYNNIGSPLVSTKSQVNPTSTMYYRVAVTCGSSTVYSDSVRVTVAPFFPSGTYTINSMSPTSGTNFNSFTEAVNAIRCGITGPVVFNVSASGSPYLENIVIPAINGTSSASTITFNGNGSILRFEQNSGTGPRTAILLDGADHININNLYVDVSTGTYGWGIQLINNADSNSIVRCTINTSVTNTTNANHAGIIIGGTSTSPTSAGNAGHYNLIDSNTVNGGYFGISLSGNSAVGGHSKNNIVTNNIVRDVYSHSIILSYQSGALVSSNDISRPNRSASVTAAGIYLGTADINTLVEKNRIHNMFDGMVANTSTYYGIYIGADGTAANVNRIENNLVHNTIHNGPFYGIYNTGADYVNIYHNTIASLDNTATTGTTFGVFVAGVVTEVNIFNNIIYLKRSGTGTKRVFYFVNTSSTIKTNRNILFLDDRSAGSDNHVGQWGTDNYTTLADWKTANNNAFDTLSLDLDPLFVNAAAGNYTPTEPVVDNLGAPLGVLTDIVGVTRSMVSPDAGAYEFTAPACSTPEAGTATVSQTGMVCPNHSVVLSLTGNSIGSGQTYQWQSAPSANGPFTNVATISNYKAVTIQPTVTMYYRAVVTCGGLTDYSDTFSIPIASLFPGGTYTINSALPTGGSNFTSFSDAVYAIRCGITSGVTFNVSPTSGPYNEQITIPEIVNASGVNKVVFNGNGRTIQFTPHSEGRHIIKLNGANHITFDSLRIVGLDATYGWGIHLMRGADSNTITRCTIDMSAVTSTVQNNSAGIAATNSSTSAVTSGNNAHHTTITRNTIIGAWTGIGLYGLTVGQGGIGNVITNNIVRDFYATGILIMWNDSAVIANNEFHRANRVTVGTFTGIELRAGCRNARVNANRVHSSHTSASAQNGAAYGIFMNLCDAPAGQENKITNNLIYNLNSQSGTIYGLYNSTSDGVFYYHNSVVINNPSATGGITHGFSEQTNLGRTGRLLAHAHMTLLNNLFYINRGGTGEKVVLSFLTNPNNITSNYNNLYNYSSEAGNFIAKLGGTTTYATLAAWKAANGGIYDQQSVSINPAFANAAGFDFTPTQTTLDNLGMNVGIPHDLFGNPRSATTPDIGAIEFEGALPVTLLSFNGMRQGAVNKLYWSVTNEVNNAGFELQRSAEGTTFETFGFIPSVSMQTAAINNYAFTDEKPFAGATYYRLKQMDRDGKFTYSNVVSIRSEAPSEFRIVRAYPNPVVNSLNVDISAPVNVKATMLVSDVSGKTHLQQQVTLTAGQNMIHVSSARLASGTYILKVIDENGKILPAHVFVKQ